MPMPKRLPNETPEAFRERVKVEQGEWEREQAAKIAALDDTKPAGLGAPVDMGTFKPMHPQGTEESDEEGTAS